MEVVHNSQYLLVEKIIGTVSIVDKYVVKHKQVCEATHDVCCKKVRDRSQYKPFNIKYKQSEI